MEGDERVKSLSHNVLIKKKSTPFVHDILNLLRNLFIILCDSEQRRRCNIPFRKYVWKIFVIKYRQNFICFLSDFLLALLLKFVGLTPTKLIVFRFLKQSLLPNKLNSKILFWFFALNSSKHYHGAK